MRKIRLFNGLLITTALCVSACAIEPSDQAKSSEEILAAEGQWTLVEDRPVPQSAPAPVQKTPMSQPVALTPEDKMMSPEAAPMAPAPMVDDIPTRVAKLEAQMKAIQAELASLMAKPKALKTPKTIDQVVAKASKKSPKMVKKAVGGPLRVLGVRVGEHPGKTRFVMDLSNTAPKYSVDIDNTEKLAVVELPGTGWEAAMSNTLKKSAFVQSYSVQKTDSGSRVVILLKKPAQLAMNSAMKPNHVHGHRIAFDLVAN